MSDKFKWLQFFADGASGGDGAADGAGSGETTGDADRGTLEDLGVPHDRAERFRQRRKDRDGRTEEPVRAEGPAPEPEKPKPMDWDSFMQIPENRQRLQQMMAERGKKATEEKRAADEKIGKLSPVLELLASKYGLETKDGQVDLAAVVKAVQDDDSTYERKAGALGVDVAVARQLEQAAMERRRAEAEATALREQQERQEREFRLRQHFLKMQQQATQLRELFPDFDLNRELQNPEFLRRTSPEGGLSVADAFYSLHHDEVMQQQAEAIARRAKADVAASIRTGRHPRENGGSGTAVASGTPNLKQMTREQRTAYIKAKYAPP